jgi:chromosome segregation ATPase
MNPQMEIALLKARLAAQVIETEELNQKLTDLDNLWDTASATITRLERENLEKKRGLDILEDELRRDHKKLAGLSARISELTEDRMEMLSARTAIQARQQLSQIFKDLIPALRTLESLDSDLVDLDATLSNIQFGTQ